MVATCKRPQMLGDLLSSLVDARIPAGAEVSFIVVDNDTRQSGRATFEAFAERVGAERARYAVEARRGIPFARNRGLAEALASGADLAAFVDDDETVDPDWLATLVTAAVTRDLDLVGGPVRAVPYNDPANVWRRTLMKGVTARYRNKERRSQRYMSTGRDDRLVIVTNNWLVDLAWLKRSGVRFDESLRYSGGSDVRFFDAARTAGVKSGWCAAAVVYEAMPDSRLSYRYQFRRSRDQATSSFHRKFQARTPLAAVSTFGGILLKGTLCAICAMSAPVVGGPAIVQTARLSGWVAGRMKALLGGRSTYYVTIDGA